jgi:hypothetical protein
VKFKKLKNKKDDEKRRSFLGGARGEKEEGKKRIVK